VNYSEKRKEIHSVIISGSVAGFISFQFNNLLIVTVQSVPFMNTGA